MIYRCVATFRTIERQFINDTARSSNPLGSRTIVNVSRCQFGCLHYPLSFPKFLFTSLWNKWVLVAGISPVCVSVWEWVRLRYLGPIPSDPNRSISRDKNPANFSVIYSLWPDGMAGRIYSDRVLSPFSTRQTARYIHHMYAKGGIPNLFCSCV